MSKYRDCPEKIGTDGHLSQNKHSVDQTRCHNVQQRVVISSSAAWQNSSLVNMNDEINDQVK